MVAPAIARLAEIHAALVGVVISCFIVVAIYRLAAPFIVK